MMWTNRNDPLRLGGEGIEGTEFPAEVNEEGESGAGLLTWWSANHILQGQYIASCLAWSLRHHRAVARLVYGSRPSNTTTIHIRCHQMDSSKESILGGVVIYQTNTIGNDWYHDEIDINPYVLTTYQVNDYVFGGTVLVSSLMTSSVLIYFI